MKQRFLVILAIVSLGIVSLGITGCGSSIAGASGFGAPFVSSVVATSNPQVAAYTITTPKAATVAIEYGQDADYKLNTWSVATPDAGGSVTIQVAGMLPSTTYHMRAFITYKDGSKARDSDHTFTSGALPAKVAVQFSASTTSGMTPQPGIELINGVSTNIPTIVASDLKGNIIWTYPFTDFVPLTGQAAGPLYGLQLQGSQQLSNGDLLLVIAPISNFALGAAAADASLPNEIREIDLVGNTIKSLKIAALQASMKQAGFSMVPYGFSHAVRALDNGHWLLLVGVEQSVVLTGATTATNVIGDGIIDVDENMKPVWAWNPFDHLDVNRHPYMFPDWTHANAIVYSKDDGNLLFSMRHQNWILKIDYRNGAGAGDVIWHLGPGADSDFTLENSDGTKDTKSEDWFYSQHYPTFFSTNTTGDFKLGMMDNGDARLLSNGTGCLANGGAACYSTIPVLEINETARTAKFLFHQVLSPALFNQFGGNTNLLENGNIEYDLCAFLGWGASVVEVTPQSSPQTVWQLNAPSPTTLYQAFRIPSLYPGVQWTGTDF